MNASPSRRYGGWSTDSGDAMGSRMRSDSTCTAWENGLPAIRERSVGGATDSWLVELCRFVRPSTLRISITITRRSRVYYANGASGCKLVARWDCCALGLLRVGIVARWDARMVRGVM